MDTRPPSPGATPPGEQPASPARRHLLRAFVAATAASVATACNRAAEFSCAEAPGLSESDRAARRLFGYVDRASDEARRCDRCTHFVPAGGASCGACRLVRGPIHPRGSCNVFASKA